MFSRYRVHRPTVLFEDSHENDNLLETTDQYYPEEKENNIPTRCLSKRKSLTKKEKQIMQRHKENDDRYYEEQLKGIDDYELIIENENKSKELIQMKKSILPAENPRKISVFDKSYEDQSFDFSAVASNRDAILRPFSQLTVTKRSTIYRPCTIRRLTHIRPHINHPLLHDVTQEPIDQRQSIITTQLSDKDLCRLSMAFISDFNRLRMINTPVALENEHDNTFKALNQQSTCHLAQIDQEQSHSLKSSNPLQPVSNGHEPERIDDSHCNHLKKSIISFDLTPMTITRKSVKRSMKKSNIHNQLSYVKEEECEESGDTSTRTGCQSAPLLRNMQRINEADESTTVTSRDITVKDDHSTTNIDDTAAFLSKLTPAPILKSANISLRRLRSRTDCSKTIQNNTSRPFEQDSYNESVQEPSMMMQPLINSKPNLKNITTCLYEPSNTVSNNLFANSSNTSNFSSHTEVEETYSDTSTIGNDIEQIDQSVKNDAGILKKTEAAFESESEDDSIIEIGSVIRTDTQSNEKKSIEKFNHSQSAGDKQAFQTDTNLKFLLRLCNASCVISWNDVFQNSSQKMGAKKLGEGSYADVYLVQTYVADEPIVIKIQPIIIDDSDPIVKYNDETPKFAVDVINEVCITQCMVSLGDEAIYPRHNMKGFINCHAVDIVKGAIPQLILDAFDEYYNLCVKQKRFDDAYNDRPSIFPNSQHFVVFHCGYGGCDLEKYKIDSIEQAYSILSQIIHALAVAEHLIEFEHRDLHIGNVLVTDSPKRHSVKCTFDGRARNICTFGAVTHIIDYTNSRSKKDGIVLFNDLDVDEQLFEGRGDYQFECYRLMRDVVNNEWDRFHPQTNVIWIGYLARKLTDKARYYSKARITAKRTAYLKALVQEIEEYESCCDMVRAPRDTLKVLFDIVISYY